MPSSNTISTIIPRFKAEGIFADFTPAETNMLAAHGAVQEVAQGATIIRQSEEQDSFYVILRGRVQVIKEPEEPGKSASVIAELGPNEGFGEMAIFNPPFAAATVQALENTRLWRLTRMELQNVLALKPELGNQLFARLLQIFGSRV